MGASTGNASENTRMICLYSHSHQLLLFVFKRFGLEGIWGVSSLVLSIL